MYCWHCIIFWSFTSPPPLHHDYSIIFLPLNLINLCGVRMFGEWLFEVTSVSCLFAEDGEPAFGVPYNFDYHVDNRGQHRCMQRAGQSSSADQYVLIISVLPKHILFLSTVEPLLRDHPDPSGKATWPLTRGHPSWKATFLMQKPRGGLTIGVPLYYIIFW